MVEAATDVTALHLSKAAFDQLAAERTGVARQMVTNIALEMAVRFSLTGQRSANRMLSR